MAKQYKSLHPVKYYRDYLTHNVRPDGRSLDTYRPVIINSESFATADGSSIAKVGRTCVTCGIKAEFCVPKAERPNEGFLVVNLELPPLCSSRFKPGPPSEQAQAATKAIVEIVESSGCVRLDELCVAREKLAWCLYADLVCLDHDGSVIDAALLALFTALRSLRLPAVEYDPALDNQLVDLERRNGVKLYGTPVSTTFAVFDDVILTDPTSEEESLCSGIVTVVVKGDELCMVLKPGGQPLSKDKLQLCIKQSKERSADLVELIRTATRASGVV